MTIQPYVERSPSVRLTPPPPALARVRGTGWTADATASGHHPTSHTTCKPNIKPATCSTHLQGFYTTYRTLFDLISDEEVTNGSKLDYPSFGYSSSVWASTPAQPTDIRAFYNGWLNFATEKEFAWKDQYRVEEGMDRMMKRAIEKENQRERRAGRREYNECVRVSNTPHPWLASLAGLELT